MRRKRLTVLSLLLIVRPWQARSAPDDPAASPSVGVLIHNLSDAQPVTVEKAEATCRQVFIRAGIRTAWINSANDVTLQGTDIVLRVVILQQPPASSAMDVIGTSFPLKTEGIQILIYHHRVVQLSRSVDLPVPDILSAALLHEIGHMLLGSTEHSMSGVMRGLWDARIISDLGRGQLTFTSEERRHMRSNMQRMAAGRRESGTAPVDRAVRSDEAVKR